MQEKNLASSSFLCVVSNEVVANGVNKICFEATDQLLNAKPGSFVHVAIDGVFLRRPFGVHSVDVENSTFSIAFAVKGKGTQALAKVEPNQKLDVLGPLGNGFSLPDNAKGILLIAGGLGIAPILHSVRWASKKVKCDVLLGFASKTHAFAIDELNACCKNVGVATDDGTLGGKGSVTQLIEPFMKANKPDAIWICGPTGLYRALKKLDFLKGKGVQISLEERMGCGIGACLTCNCKIGSSDDWKYKRVCADGPVFLMDEVILDGE